MPAEAAILTFFVVEEAPTAMANQLSKKMMKELVADKKAVRLSTGKMKPKYLIAIKRTVFRSVAEVERLWNMAGHILTKEWASMSPIVFECIM